MMPLSINSSLKLYDVILNNAKEKLSLEEIKKQNKFSKILKTKVLESEDKNKKEDTRLLDACYDLEALFINQMVKVMRKTVNETDFFGKSIAKDIFSDMLYDEYAKQMARSEKFGIAKQIYNQLSA